MYFIILLYSTYASFVSRYYWVCLQDFYKVLSKLIENKAQIMDKSFTFLYQFLKSYKSFICSKSKTE